MWGYELSSLLQRAAHWCYQTLQNNQALCSYLSRYRRASETVILVLRHKRAVFVYYPDDIFLPVFDVSISNSVIAEADQSVVIVKVSNPNSSIKNWLKSFNLNQPFNISVKSLLYFYQFLLYIFLRQSQSYLLYTFLFFYFLLKIYNSANNIIWIYFSQETVLVRYKSY